MAVTAADLQIKFSSDTRAAEAGIDRMGSKVKGLGSLMSTALGTAGGFLLGGAIREVVGGFGSLVKGGLDFGAAMANVNSIAQLTDGQLKDLSASVNDLAYKTAQAPQVLAAGLYDIYSSGFQGAEALDVLEASANAATAGLTTTDVAARAITSVMNAYTNQNITASQASDILFQTVQDGVITFDQLANNMANTLAPANALGISFEQLAAAYAQMTLKGVSAAQSETQIAALMRSAANPTDDLTAATQAYGYESTQALLAAEGMPGLLKAIDQAAGGNTESLYDMLGSQEAVNAALILGEDGAKAYNDELERMEHAAGATDKALTKQSKSAAFQMKQAKVAIQQAATVLIGALSPAIGAVAHGLGFLVVNGLTPAFEWFGRILDPIGRLAGLLKEAFGGGAGVSDLMNVLFGGLAEFHNAPMLLQAIAGELLEIADAAGDVFAAFRSDGMAGVADVIGEEVGNILSSLGELALITLDVVVDIASFVLGKIPDIGAWLLSVIGVGEKTSQRGDGNATVTLWDVVVDIGSWTLGAVADLGQWIEDTIGGGTAQDATGGPGAPVLHQHVEIEALAVDILNFVVGNISATANDIAPEVQAWIDGHPADSIVQVVNITELQPTFRSLSRNDYDGAIKRFLEADPIEVTPQIELRISDAVNNALSGGAGGDAGGGIDWSRLTTILQNSYLLANPAQVFGNWVADDIVVSLRAAMDGLMRDVFGDGASLADDLNPWGEGGTSQDAFQGFVDDMIAAIEGIPGKIADGVGEIEIDIPTPSLPDWITDFGWLTGPIDALIGFIGEQIARIIGKFAELNNAKAGGGITNNMGADFGGRSGAPDFDYGDLGKGGFQGQPTEVEVPVTLKPVVESVDWSVIKESLNPFGGGFGTGGDSPFAGMAIAAEVNLDATIGNMDQVRSDLGSQLEGLFGGGAVGTTEATFTATFTADNGDVAQKYTEVMSWGGIWEAATFTGAFAGDNGPAALAYTDAYGWGDTWAAATFTATLDADNSAALSAIQEAMDAGNSFAGMNFSASASISVDTSGITDAVGVARQAAQDIANVLPHSPAKEGPLSVVPNFDYLVEAAQSSFSKLRPMAESGLSDWFGSGRGGTYGSDSRSGSGATNVTLNINGNIYGIDDFENAVVDTFTTKIGPSITMAIGRRNRQLGA